MIGTQEALATEAAQAALCLIAMKDVQHCSYAYGDGNKRIGINFSLEACEIAARLTGVAPFFAKMLNYKFRVDAAELMFERALEGLG